MTINPALLAGFDIFASGETNSIDFSMFELIRNLSNVSTQFRKEFGDILWGRTKIAFSAHQEFDIEPAQPVYPQRPPKYPLPGLHLVQHGQDGTGPWSQAFAEFLEQRPAVRSGIRKLDREIRLKYIGRDMESSGKHLKDYCELFASMPNLKALKMYAIIRHGDSDDIEDISHGPAARNFAWFSATCPSARKLTFRSA